MKPEDMKIAAALSVGWTRKPVPQPVNGPLKTIPVMRWVREDGSDFQMLPHYDTLLDATVELIKTLEVGHDGSDAANYQETLYGIVNPGRDFVEDFCNGVDVAYLQAMLLATPLQQLEAYLKVKELWK